MDKVLFIVLLLIGVIGAAIAVMFRRGLMRNGYFTIGSSIIIAFLMMITYQTLPAIALIFVPEAQAEDPQLLLSLSSLGQLVILVGGSLLLIRATEQDVPATLRLEGIQDTPFKLYMLGIPIMLFTTVVFGSISQVWIKALEQLPFYDELEKLNALNEELIQKLTTYHTPSDFIVVLLAVAIVPAIAEEVFFRGFLQTNIERSGNGRSRPYTALLIASFIFALVHFSPFQFLGLLGLGLAMGYMSYRTNNLLVGSFAHAFNNGSFVIATAFAGQLPNESAEMAKLSVGMLLLTAAFGSFLLAVVVYLFHQWSEPLQARHFAEHEVRATTAYYAAKELERYNEEMLAELEARERIEQRGRPEISERPEQSERLERKELNDHP